MCAQGAPTGGRGAAGGPRAGRGWCWLLCHGAPGLGVPAHPLPGLFSILIPAVPGSGAPLPGALGPSCPRSCCGQGGALGAGSSSCSWWQFKRIGSVPEWLWITRLELLQRRKQGMLAPSSCLCLAVPLHPSLGQRLCPSPGLSSASLQSPECCGGSRGHHSPWEQPRCWAGAAGAGTRDRDPALPVLPVVIYGEQTRQPGLCPSALASKHLQKGWKNPRASGVESPDSWGGSAVSVSPGQVAALQEPCVCQPGSSNPCMAGGARVGSSPLPCLPHHVLWAKPEQGNSL